MAVGNIDSIEVYEKLVKDREEAKEYKIKLVEEFYREYQRLPKWNEKYKGVALGTFLNNIKSGNTSITVEQMERLVVLGLKDKEEKKEEKIELIEELYRENKRLPRGRKKYKGVALGTFLNSIKQGNTSITEEQKERLQKLGFVEHAKDIEEEKEYKIRLIEAFYEKYKELPKGKEKYKGVALGQFLNNIKSKNTSITEKQKERLMVLGFGEQAREEKKEEKIKLVEEFYEENKRLPRWNEIYQGVMLGQFLSNIKTGNTSITEEQMKKLIKLGFEGQIKDIKIDSSIQKIVEFYEKNNRLPEPGESLKNEKAKIGDILLSIRVGKIRITESQFLRLQQMNARLTREQVKFFEKPHVYVKK